MRVKWTRAALLAEYAAMPAEGSIPGRAAMCTMAPEPFLCMYGATAWLSHNAGPRLTSIIWRNRSGVVVQRVPGLERTDGVDQRVRRADVADDPFDHWTGGLRVGGIGQFAGDAVGKLFQTGPVPVDRHHGHAAVGQLDGRRPTELATRRRPRLPPGPLGACRSSFDAPSFLGPPGQMAVEPAGGHRGSRSKSKYCLVKQVSLEGMSTVEPLSPTEEALWRAVMRIVKVIPRHLDSDLVRGAGLTASEYTTIMHLSEAPNRELRMADLASATDLSASRMTRLVDDLQSRGLVTKTTSSSDARGNVARLTPRGMAKLKSAWPVHLASVRRRFLDCIDAAAVEGVAKALAEVAVHLDARLANHEGDVRGLSQVPTRLLEDRLRRLLLRVRFALP